MIITCKDCGKKIEGVKRQKYCDECRVHRNREHSRQWWARLRLEAAKRSMTYVAVLNERRRRGDANKKKASDKTLEQWVREAAECNMDYGTYRALIERGHTFEELKTGASNRRVPCHAHSWHFS